MTGPQDPATAGGDRLRAGHADREQVIEILKAAFVHGRLTKGELDMRVGRALAARTYADLAALTADIPAERAATGPASQPAPARRRPLARAAAGSGGCLVIAFGAMQLISLAAPSPTTPGSIPRALAVPLFYVLCSAVIAALVILGRGVAASVDQGRSRRQFPPRQRPGGRALQAGRRGGGHDPGSSGPRPDQARADLRSDSSRPRRPHSSGRGVRTPRSIRPVPDTW
jgi:hypothetical protein